MFYNKAFWIAESLKLRQHRPNDSDVMTYVHEPKETTQRKLSLQVEMFSCNFCLHDYLHIEYGLAEQ